MTAVANSTHATALAAAAPLPIIPSTQSTVNSALASAEAPLSSTTPSLLALSHTHASVDMYPFDSVVAQMQQENIALLSKQAGTSDADRRARLRAEKFTGLRE